MDGTKGVCLLVLLPRWLRPQHGVCGLWWPAEGSGPGKVVSATRAQGEVSQPRDEAGTSCTSTRAMATVHSLSWTWSGCAHARKKPHAPWSTARGSCGRKTCRRSLVRLCGPAVLGRSALTIGCSLFGKMGVRDTLQLGAVLLQEF